MTVLVRVLFFVALAAVAATVVLRSPAIDLSEASMYTVAYRPAAMSLLDSGAYDQTTPLWGYPLFIALIRSLAGDSLETLLPPLQVLTLFGVVLAYLWSWASRVRWWLSLVMAGLLYPVFNSVVYPYAEAVYVVGLLLVVLSLRNWSRSGHWGWLLAGGAGGAIAANTRPGGLLLIAALALAAGLLRLLRPDAFSRAFLRFAGTVAVATVVSLAPWAMNALPIAGRPILTATNGPGVLYMSLGQLPDNPWGREALDREAGDYALSRGVDDPFSARGAEVMLPAFVDDVLAHPFAFVRKVLHNAGCAVSGGSGGGVSEVLFTPLFAVMIYLSVVAGGLAVSRSDWPQDTRALLLMAGVFTVATIAIVSLSYYGARLMVPVYAIEALVLAQVAADHRLSSREPVRSAWE